MTVSAAAADSDRAHTPAELVEVFVENLGRALHRYGSPAHRLEEAMVLVARRLGIDGQFFSTPTAIFASLGTPGRRRTVLVRVEPGDVDLERLETLDGILGDLVHGRIDLDAAGRRVDAAVAAPRRYGALAQLLAFALVSGAGAQFFGGGLREVWAATAIGGVIGLLGLLVERSPASGRLFELVAALIASALATFAAAWAGVGSPFLVTLSGLIALLPGLTLTVAMTELASRHLVSGAARIAGAVLVFLMLAFGVALGQRLASLLVTLPPAAVPTPLPPWTVLPALALAAAGLMVLFRASPARYGWLLLAGAVGLLGSHFGTRLLGPELGAMAGATVVGLAGNAYSRLLDRPAVALQMPGLILLVPGSIGLRSLASLLDQDAIAGVQTAFTMTLVAVALVTGLLVANVLLPPRRPL